MMKIFSLSLLFTAASWSTANACSYHFPPNFQFQYETLEQGTLNTRWSWSKKRSEKPLTELLSNLDILMIARPAEDQILTDRPNTWWSNDEDDREYWRIRWDALRYIKGDSLAPLYVRDTKGNITPILSQDAETNVSKSKTGISQSEARENFLEAIETRMSNRIGFPFWDAPVLENTKLVDVTTFTSCGEVYIPAFDFNRYYLVGLDNNGATAFAEPLFDENDPLVAGVERIVISGQFSPDISLETFLSEMEFRDVVEIESCSFELQNRNATSEVWAPYTEDISSGWYNTNDTDYGKEITFSRVGTSSKTDIDIKQLSQKYPALLEYFDKDKSKVQCRAGEQFAVYGDADIFNQSTHFARPNIIPKYRFARVENGSVRVEDILTNYTLTGPSQISITEFRSPTPEVEE